MIVCLCKGVSSGTIQRELRRGARTVSEIAKSCAAGTCCGACNAQIRDLVRGAGSVARGRRDDVAGR